MNTESIDRIQWKNTAYEFLEDCIKCLWSDKGHKALDYLHWRGLQDRTIKEWMLGYHPDDAFFNTREWGIEGGRGKMVISRGIIIPCQDEFGLHYLNIRTNQGDEKYKKVKGSKTWLYGARTFKKNLIGFLFEGEFDALLAWQTEYVLGYASLPAKQKIKPAYQPFFDEMIDVIVAYDDDEAGHKAADDLCDQFPGFTKATSFPFGKDLTEYYQMGGDVLGWIQEQVLYLA